MSIRKHVKCSVVGKENIDMEPQKILRINACAIAKEHEIEQEETPNNNICVSTDLGPLFISCFLADSSGYL